MFSTSLFAPSQREKFRSLLNLCRNVSTSIILLIVYDSYWGRNGSWCSNHRSRNCWGCCSFRNNDKIDTLMIESASGPRKGLIPKQNKNFEGDNIPTHMSVELQFRTRTIA
tara:strand:+ start:1027 stop:1359 length:333 start_codon:yes stop_codon:yes gene_type:complete